MQQMLPGCNCVYNCGGWGGRALGSERVTRRVLYMFICGVHGWREWTGVDHVQSMPMGRDMGSSVQSRCARWRQGPREKDRKNPTSWSSAMDSSILFRSVQVFCWFENGSPSYSTLQQVTQAGHDGRKRWAAGRLLRPALPARAAYAERAVDPLFPLECWRGSAMAGGHPYAVSMAQARVQVLCCGSAARQSVAGWGAALLQREASNSPHQLAVGCIAGGAGLVWARQRLQRRHLWPPARRDGADDLQAEEATMEG